MKNFRFRKANLQDSPGLAYVHVHSWRTTYKGIVSENYLQSLSIEEREQKWVQILSGTHHTYVCELDDGKIIGFVSFGKERSGEYEGELYAIYLLEEYQGKGIGKEFLKIAATRLKEQGYNSMWIWVLKENPSKHFYYAFKPTLIKEEVLTIGGESHQEEGLLLELK
ncbi:GNAT family N-acetyltransferase [Rossellomorea yichunensis]|uniref:GNAT family N-acetyltransferase n=1 Tax=Rossellomorea yichunensis TaxID=3077331 RepID=UPI0028DF5FFE|nr:GNAT family N-acetyltransferase [Rossellomorea sp. YC4-1]MDT9026104.1 GNAT family N-acetyltransferase [Rossellomorea sp. YC4-1]